VCDLETSRIGAPYIYNVRLLRVNRVGHVFLVLVYSLKMALKCRNLQELIRTLK